MDQKFEQWSEQLQEAGDKLAEAYEMLAGLQRELKECGHKKDAQALGEPLERIARYGRLFEDMRQTWADPDG
jgi:hypothetical protein